MEIENDNDSDQVKQKIKRRRTEVDEEVLGQASPVGKNVTLYFRLVESQEDCKKQQLVQADTQEEEVLHTAQKASCVREVETCKTNYFVSLPQIKQQEDLWGEENLMWEMAVELDGEDRLEQVAVKQSKFWAAEILMNNTWRMIKERKMMKPFLRKLLVRSLSQVLMCRELVLYLVDAASERAIRTARIMKCDKLRSEALIKRKTRKARTQRALILK